MKLNSLVKYQIWDGRKALCAFYIVIFTLLAFSVVSTMIFEGEISVNGMEFASAVFIFIAGITSFKDVFKYGLANGLSRKTIFMSFVISIFPFAGIMALVDTTLRFVGGFINGYESIFFGVYGDRYGNIETFLSYIEGFLWMLFLYTMIAGVGYLISLIYYRSNKMMKLIVSIAPPVTLIVLLPLIDRLIPGGIINRLSRFFLIFFGKYNTTNPYICMAFSFLVFFIMVGFSYLLIRKAPIKR